MFDSSAGQEHERRRGAAFTLPSVRSIEQTEREPTLRRALFDRSNTLAAGGLPEASGTMHGP